MNEQLKELSVGARVRVTTATESTCEGRLFCYEAAAGILVLEEGDERDREHHDIRMISTAGLKKIEVISPAPEKLDLALPSITPESVVEKERRARKREEENLKRVADFASPAQQHLFDKLYIMYGSEWKGKDMYIPTVGVTISPPYSSECCSGSDKQALARIKKIVKNIADDLSAATSS